jgi:isoaspartyl peptidase/L-asparaginase-like protein (Ntn-hydrolase superfamily)
MSRRSSWLLIGAGVFAGSSVNLITGFGTDGCGVSLIAVNQVKYQVAECVAYRDEYQQSNPAAIDKVEANNGEIKVRCNELGVNLDDG